MSGNDEVVERLDRLIALFKIGFADSLERVRNEIRSDPVAAAVLDMLDDEWVTSGDLQRMVLKATKVSDRTVQRSLGTLSQRGLIEVKGSGRSTSYRSSGVLR